jgi:hypothetical protein
MASLWPDLRIRSAPTRAQMPNDTPNSQRPRAIVKAAAMAYGRTSLCMSQLGPDDCAQALFSRGLLPIFPDLFGSLGKRNETKVFGMSCVFRSTEGALQLQHKNFCQHWWLLNTFYRHGVERPKFTYLFHSNCELAFPSLGQYALDVEFGDRIRLATQKDHEAMDGRSS